MGVQKDIISDLKVCRLSKAIGIDALPVFQWVVSHSGNQGEQSAYCIRVATSRELLKEKQSDLWDSGWIVSPNSFDILYAGKQLPPATICYWQVEVKLGQSEAVEVSEIAQFSTGLPQNLWKGQWIGLSKEQRTAPRRAAVTLRREFDAEKPVRQALAFVCGLGLFEFLLNGEKADDSYLNPYQTQYNKTILYRTFDLTQKICKGRNVICVDLGNGFYNEPAGVWNWQTACWRGEPKLLFQLEITYEDGSVQTIVSDQNWKGSDQGPIVENSVYYGEVYDERKRWEGYTKPGFDDSNWNLVSEMPAPEGRLKASMRMPVQKIARLPVKKITQQGDVIIIESQEMTSGWIRLNHICEEIGNEIVITYGQQLQPDGTVVKWGGKDGKCREWWPEHYIQQDHYFSAGKKNASYEPKFSCKGFRYIQIEGWHGTFTSEDVEIYRISNGIDRISSFHCSDPFLNQLHQMMLISMENNYEGEHCDPLLEKNGWLGDANVSLDCLAYNLDIPGYLPGWIDVMQDCLHQYGLLPPMVPTADWNISEHVVWNSLFVFGVEALQNYFGMNQYAKQQYAVMREYCLGTMENMKKNGWLCDDEQLGDWVSPIGGSDPFASYCEQTSEGSALVGTAYFYGALRYMRQLATSIGKLQDAQEYASAMEQIYHAFQSAFWKEEQGSYETNFWREIGTRSRYRQSSNLVPLAFGLVPEDRVSVVVKNLIQDIHEKGDHLDTGCVGTRHLLPVLSDYGYGELAYRILTNQTYPSWNFCIQESGVCTWEMWEASTRSLDHYFLGTYDAWLYGYLVGIRNVKNGYETFEIKPELIQKISNAQASIHTVRGMVSVSWQKDEKEAVQMEITVPMGAEAKLVLPLKENTDVEVNEKKQSDPAAGIRLPMGTYTIRFFVVGY